MNMDRASWPPGEKSLAARTGGAKGPQAKKILGWRISGGLGVQPPVFKISRGLGAQPPEKF